MFQLSCYFIPDFSFTGLLLVIIPVLHTPGIFPSVLSNVGAAIWDMKWKTRPQIEIFATTWFLWLPLRDYINICLSSVWVLDEREGKARQGFICYGKCHRGSVRSSFFSYTSKKRNKTGDNSRSIEDAHQDFLLPLFVMLR